MEASLATGVKVIHAVDLSESFGNKSGLVVLDLPGHILLDVQYPFACNNIPPPWPLNNSPSSHLFQCLQFHPNHQVPLQPVHSPHLLERGRIQCLSFSNYCGHCEFHTADLHHFFVHSSSSSVLFPFLGCQKALKKERLVLLSI